jgi:preprotein translocase subunit SecE
MAEAVRVKEEAQSGARKGGNGDKGPGAAAAATGWFSARWGRLRTFLHDVRVELKQVTWPTRNDVKATTAVVLATVAFFAAYFFVVDMGTGWLVQWILHYFKK